MRFLGVLFFGGISWLAFYGGMIFLVLGLFNVGFFYFGLILFAVSFVAANLSIRCGVKFLKDI